MWTLMIILLVLCILFTTINIVEKYKLITYESKAMKRYFYKKQLKK